MLILNATLLTGFNSKKLLEKHGLRILNGTVVEIGPSQELSKKYP